MAKHNYGRWRGRLRSALATSCAVPLHPCSHAMLLDGRSGDDEATEPQRLAPVAAAAGLVGPPLRPPAVPQCSVIKKDEMRT